MVTMIYYPGTHAEKRIETDWNLNAAGLYNMPTIDWREDLALIAGGPGFWVNGAGLKGLGFDLRKHILVGKPTTGRQPKAWLMEDGEALWICLREGYGPQALYHRIPAPLTQNLSAEGCDAFGRPLAGEELIPAARKR